MRILQITAIAETVQKFLLPQIDYLLSQGIEVGIACSPSHETEKLISKGYMVHSVDIKRKLDITSTINSIRNLKRIIESGKYDVVHVHTPIASFLGRIAAKLAGVNTIVYTAHGFFFHDITPPIKYLLFHAIETATAKITDLIYSVNYEDIEMIKRTKLCPSDKVQYLGSIGVDLSKFNPCNINQNNQESLRQLLGIPKSANPIIGTVGRLNKKKGSLYLIEAIAQLRPQFPNIHALIVGGELSSDRDSCQREVIARINTLGLEQNITLTGYREDVPELMSLMNLFTLPTFTHEGLPTVIIEAMAMKKPVVASDIRGCREAVVHDHTGLIVPPQNAEALAHAIATLLREPQKCREMGLAGRQRVEAEYDLHLVIQRFAEGYRKLGILPACKCAR